MTSQVLGLGLGLVSHVLDSITVHHKCLLIAPCGGGGRQTSRQLSHASTAVPYNEKESTRRLMSEANLASAFRRVLLCSRPLSGCIKRWCASDVWSLSDVCLSVAYIGPKLRTERSRKTKIGTEVVAHVTRDSDTTFKIKWSKVKGQGHRGRRHIVAASRTAC